MITTFINSFTETKGLIRTLKTISSNKIIKCYSICSATLKEELDLLLQEELELEQTYPEYSSNIVRIVVFKPFGGAAYVAEQSYCLLKAEHQYKEQKKKERKFWHKFWHFGK